MELILLRVFQRQVAGQCRVVMSSVPIINQAASTADHDALWVGCQMFAVGSANVSKALWGDGKNRSKVAAQRQPLRDSLGVDDTSPLYDLSLRNHFEHFDERIDKWWAEDPNHNILDRMIGPPSAVVGLPDISRFRVYDPSGPSLVLWGQKYDLQPIASECDRIFPIAQREADKPHWEPPTTSGSGQ